MHNIEHRNYPEKVDIRKIENEIDEYATYETRDEGGHGLYNPIRWLGNKVYNSEEEAYAAIEMLDRGGYDSLAVKYHRYIIPNDAKVKELMSKENDARKEYEKKDGALYPETLTSVFIGCKKCGSRLARKFLYTNFCPVCKNNLRPDSTMKAIESAKKKWNKAGEAVLEYQKKNCKKETMWLVKFEYHT